MSNEISNKFGGAWWDTLFLFVQDNDGDFILDFTSRIPCQDCKKTFHQFTKRKDLNKYNKEELRRILWTTRCKMDPKYKDMDNEVSYNDYLMFLTLV